MRYVGILALTPHLVHLEIDMESIDMYDGTSQAFTRSLMPTSPTSSRTWRFWISAFDCWNDHVVLRSRDAAAVLLCARRCRLSPVRCRGFARRGSTSAAAITENTGTQEDRDLPAYGRRFMRYYQRTKAPFL